MNNENMSKTSKCAYKSKLKRKYKNNILTKDIVYRMCLNDEIKN